MRARRADRQRDLFELNNPPNQLCDQYKQRLVPPVQAMLLENSGADDEQGGRR